MNASQSTKLSVVQSAEKTKNDYDPNSLVKITSATEEATEQQQQNEGEEGKKKLVEKVKKTLCLNYVLHRITKHIELQLMEAEKFSSKMHTIPSTSHTHTATKFTRVFDCSLLRPVRRRRRRCMSIERSETEPRQSHLIIFVTL